MIKNAFNDDDVSYIEAIYHKNMDIVHQQNYKRIVSYIYNFEEYLKENGISITNDNIIDLINEKLIYELKEINDIEEDDNNKYYYARVYYLILFYILKKDIGFEIENYKSNRYFIDIIMDILTPKLEKNLFIDKNTIFDEKTMEYITFSDQEIYSKKARGMLCDIIKIVRHYDSELKDRVLLHFDLLEESLVSSRETFNYLYNRDDITIDSFLHDLVLSHNEELIKEKFIHEQELKEKSLKRSLKSKDTTSIELLDNLSIFKAIHKDLSNFITNASPQKYKTIIESNNFGNHGKKYIKLQDKYDTVINLKRFAYVFQLELSDMKNIFRGKAVKTLNSVYLKENEKKTLFYDTLISTRNTYLYAINPEKYPYIE